MRSMSEDAVKAVLNVYFEQKGIGAQPTERGEKGPDFHIEGAVVECKGTSFNDEGLFRQLAVYAYRATDVWLGLPANAFTAKLLVKLHFLSGVLNELRGKRLKLFLVTRVEDFYHVKEFEDIGSLIPNALTDFREIAIFAQLADKPFGLWGKVSDVEARRVSESLARSIQQIDEAVEYLLIQASKVQPFHRILKSSVKVPRAPREEDDFWS